MAVTVGSARSSFGNTKAGDQNNGLEVSRQNFYVHKLGWYVIRCKDAAKRKLIADAMDKACDNNNIGYSQGTRNTLYNNIKNAGFDPSKTTKAVNTDCSALVRVCVNYAGIKVGDFITSSEKKVLMATGEFECLTSDKYCKQSIYLMRGDILVSRQKGHTVVVLSDGAKAEYSSDSTTSITDPTPDTITSTNTITVTGSSVNLRYGCGTDYDIAEVTKKGDELEKVDIKDGWTPVVKDGKILWIYSKYVE